MVSPIFSVAIEPKNDSEIGGEKSTVLEQKNHGRFEARRRDSLQDSLLKKAIGRDWKGKLSPALYIAAIVATLRSSWIAQTVFVIAALIWLIPDQRIEKRPAMSRGQAVEPQ